MKKITFLFLFLIIFMNESFAQSPLCESTATNFCCEYVESVTINGATRSGNSDFTGPGYYDYTNDILTSLVAGNTYPVSIVANTNSSYQEYVKIWFDFNGNGVLSDPGELIFDQNNAFNGSYTFIGNFTVPTSAFNGDVYLRVMMVYASTPVLCGNYSYGNTLDFKANISGGVSSEILTVNTIDNGGSGNVVSSPTGIDTAIGLNSANYTLNSLITLTATPDGSDNFTGWSGDATGLTNPLTITLDTSKNINANFGPANASPTVSNITDISTCPNTTIIGPLNFTVGDAESNASDLIVSATSSNSSLIPNSNIALGGTDENRFISLTPIGGETGTSTITINVTDEDSLTTSTTFDVTINDLIPPALTAVSNLTENVDANCEFSIPDYTGLTTATDNCGTASLSQSPAVGTVISGHNTVQTITLTADDGNGNTNTTTFDVTLADVTNPALAAVSNLTENLDANCEFSIPDYTVLTTATDNCGTATLSQSPAVGTVISGHNTVQTITLTADDGNGNTNTTTFDVTLADVTDPALTAVVNITEIVDDNCEFFIPDYTGLTTATDNCGTASLSQSPAVGTVISGHNTVQTITLTADDGNGNSNTTTFDVTLADVTDPALTAVSNLTENLDANCEFSIPDYTGLTTATDNCGTASLSQSPSVGTVISGHNTVQTITLTADDGNGNTNTTTFDVTLADVIAPALTAVSNLTENVDANCEFSIPDYTGLTTATDNCGTATLSQSPAVGTVISGHNTVQTITLTADDGNGNTNTTTFDVTLADVIIPALTAVANSTENVDANCEFSIPDYTGLTTATDNCGTVTLSQSPVVGTVISGHNTVQTITLTADDGNGNTNTTTFDVTLADVIIPALTAVANSTENVDANCEFSIPDYTGLTTATDNCGTVTLSQSPAVGTVISGHNTVQTITLTADDGNGNTNTTTFDVTLADVTNPALTAVSNLTENVDANCEFSIPDYTGLTTATDNCGTVTLSQSPAVGTVISGHNTVQTITLTADDGNGNTNTTTFDVTLADITAPNVITQNLTVQLDAFGMITITPDQIDNMSTDACGIVSMSLDNTTFSCDMIGQNTVTLTVTDVNGNSASETAIVTVEDNSAPIVLTQDITVELDENGVASIVALQIDNTSSDNCAIDTYTLDIYDFSCADLGDNTVTLTLLDVNGNQSQETAVVTIVDNVAPIALAIAPYTIQLDDIGSPITITAETIDNNSTDNCSITSLNIDVDTFTCENLGDNIVTLTVIDSSGNSATAQTTITIEDNIAPIVTTQDFTVAIDDFGLAIVSAQDFIVESYDNCSIASASIDRNNFSCAKIGNHTVNLTVTDTSGNVYTEALTLTVTGEDNDGDLIADFCDTDDNNDGILDNAPLLSEPLLVPAEAFTPNGDNINDVWLIPGIDSYTNSIVKVYNRWGHEVYVAKGYKNDWNGVYKSNSEKVPPGSYLYVIDLGNGSAVLQGWIFINY